MIDKVLIAEDQESANLSLQKTVEDLQIRQYEYVYYCDEALKRIQLAKEKGAPYDLLITDLSFEADGVPQTIADGFALITAARILQPALQILVFSAEKAPATIERLFKDYHIDGYVRKARNDAKELKTAFQALAQRQPYYPQTLVRLVKQAHTYAFTEFDIQIIRLLSQGFAQKEIPHYLKARNIQPSSLSTIEKRLSQIREELGFSKNEQLVLFCKETGIL